MAALDRKLIRDLARMWAQFSAIALIMACGVATLVMSLSTVSSLRRAQQAYYESCRFPQNFLHLKRAPLSLAARMSEIPGIQRIQTRIVVDVSLDVPGLPEPATGRLISIPDRAPYGLSELHLRRGRLPEPGRAGEVVASEAFVEAHRLGPGASLHTVINGRREAITIVGVALSPEYVYQIGPGDVFPDDRRFGVFWMLYDELAPAFDLDGAFNDVVVASAPGASEPDIVARLDDLTVPYGGLGATPRKDQTSHRYVSDEISQLRTMAMIPPTIFLSVASFIMNIVLSRIVRTQREQIAILKAFGYTNAEIGGHYLKMVLVVALCGGVMGIGAGAELGSMLTGLYRQFFRFPNIEFALNWRVAALGVGISFSAAAAGAVSSVRRAVRLPPAEAMQPEAPVDYRRSSVDLALLRRMLTPAARMTLRHLSRQPVRSTITCLGIATAVGVLILGSFSRDTVNYLIDFEFNLAQRHDIMVSFNEPAAPRSANELGALPGVIRAEPFRAVAARLRHGNVSRRVAILGLCERPTLGRVLSTAGSPVPIPGDGLLLTRSLADLLGCREGDTVTVEALEGQRPIREVRVASVVEGYLQAAAYMEIASVNRLMNESGLVSGAFLDTDPAATAKLYSTLKETPRVASVTIKRAALDSFRGTMAKNLLRMRLFNIAFACIIAFGVVYNSASISLAEQSHELATLRVLGFYRGEVAAILLGELAIITLAALPVGLLFGRVLVGIAASALQTETQRFPVIVNPSTYAVAVTVIIVASLGSAMAVRRGLDRLDLIGVLKTKG